MCLWKKVSFGWKLASCSRRGSYRSNHPACSPQDCTAQSSSLFWMEDNGGWTKVSNHVITGLVNSRFYMVPIQAPNKPALVVCWLVRSEESQVAFVFLTMATSTSRILANCFSFLESSEPSSVPAQVSNGFKDSAQNKCWPHCVWRQVSSRESVGRASLHFTHFKCNFQDVLAMSCRPHNPFKWQNLFVLLSIAHGYMSSIQCLKFYGSFMPFVLPSSLFSTSIRRLSTAGCRYKTSGKVIWTQKLGTKVQEWKFENHWKSSFQCDFSEGYSLWSDWARDNN